MISDFQQGNWRNQDLKNKNTYKHSVEHPMFNNTIYPNKNYCSLVAVNHTL